MKGFAQILLALVLALSTAGTAGAQADTTAAARTETVSPASAPPHSPKGALWRAAAVPGWGQLYNRQYYKIPLVWAGLGGIVGTALYLNRRYLLHRHALHYVTRRDEETGAPLFPEYREDYLTLLSSGFERPLTEDEAEAQRSQLARHFEANRDNLRRNRDLLYIGIGLFYGLSILDAYVNAHLLNFDIGEDLTVSLHPAPRGLTATVDLR